MKWRISDWPFLPSEKVTLHWMCSPRMVGDEKQWVMTAVFRRQNGELVDVDVPWGILPALHLGRSYQRGVMTNDIPEWNEMEFKFSSLVSYEIRRVGDILPRSLYPLVTHKNLDEHCVRISFGEHVLVVPCIEVIRAFYCPNRTMAEAILTPSGLADLVTASLDGNTLRMRFDQKMPRGILRSKYIVALIGQILTNPDWSERWKQVWHGRPNNSDATRTVPLTCEPPRLAGSRWIALGYSLGTLSFILRIVRTESSTSFPFTKIWFSHPNSVQHGEFHVGSSKGGHPSSPSNGEIQIQRDPTSPTAITQPVMLGTDISQHFSVSKMEVHEIGMKPSSEIDKNGVGQNATRYRDADKSESIEVSFYEEGGKGIMPAGEFTPLRALEESLVPDSMVPFFRAIEEMKLQRGYDVGFIIERIPTESPISRTLDDADRLYALIAIHSMDMKAYILEVDAQDGHSMSTLLYSQVDARNAPLKICLRLLNESVTPQGAWNRASITAVMENHYVLARHRRSDSRAWGQRLAKKVNRLMIESIDSK